MMRARADARLLPALAKEDAKAYLAAEERAHEAAFVEPLVAAFVRYEVYPRESGRGLGRYSAVSLIPPIGNVLHKKLAVGDADLRAGVESAVLRALAIGYAMFASLEPSVHEADMDAAVIEDRDLEAMWAFWVTHTHSRYVGKLIASDFSKVLHDISEDEFLSGLHEADALPRLGKRTKLNLLGRTYGEAGGLLRYVQTERLSDAELHGDPLAQVTMHWPLHDAP